MAFEAAVRDLGGVAAIDLHGEIDGGADEALGQAYAQAESIGANTVLLNFANATYMNSTGIALIVSILAQARKNSKTVVACGLSEHYREIFEITRLVDFVSIFDDEASAVSSAS